MKHKSKNKKTDYSQLKTKLFWRFVCLAIIAFIIIFMIYKVIWAGRGGDWVISILQQVYKMDYDSAYNLYQQAFRNNVDLIWYAGTIVVFIILLRVVLNWFTRYFDIVNQGISAILDTDTEIHLPSEMAATEQKLYSVKAELKQRTLEAQLAEQRKNELVMYLAHDIRTPLTSVIGYLNLLAEAPDMPTDQKAKYVNITLDKAYRLEKMINEFFEITRYNLQQISITKETIDLYYMLVQLSDELSPLLSANGNTTVLNADENLTVSGDPEKLARVFNNVLRNAAAYSFANSEIIISAVENDNSVIISFTNKGKTIPNEKLSAIFEKFYRMDEARTSNTGGAGLGLAIAKEIVTLHGGTITASSNNNTVTFTITLPKLN